MVGRSCNFLTYTCTADRTASVWTYKLSSGLATIMMQVLKRKRTNFKQGCCKLAGSLAVEAYEVVLWLGKGPLACKTVLRLEADIHTSVEHVF